MTMRELDRFKVIQAVADGVLKPWRAAQRLGLTTRQIRRLVARCGSRPTRTLHSRGADWVQAMERSVTGKTPREFINYL
jgi:hypothetical protein